MTCDPDLPPRAGREVTGELQVLVVDDHATARRAVALVVTACAGLDLVGTCPSGEAALDRLTRRGTPGDRGGVDVVLLDVRLTGIDGVQTARRLRAGGFGGRIVLMSTGPVDELDLGDAPVDAFLAKSELSVRTLTDLTRSWPAAPQR